MLLNSTLFFLLPPFPSFSSRYIISATDNVVNPSKPSCQYTYKHVNTKNILHFPHRLNVCVHFDSQSMGIISPQSINLLVLTTEIYQVLCKAEVPNLCSAEAPRALPRGSAAAPGK